MKTEIIKNLTFDNGGVSNVAKRTSTVFDTLPHIITWSYNGINHRIENQYKLIPLMLKDNQHIAIIEAPYNKNFNKAYIVNGEGQVIWNLNNLLQEQRPFNQLSFFDVYYIQGSLFFFVVLSNRDYRFEFDLDTGKIGDLIESR